MENDRRRGRTEPRAVYHLSQLSSFRRCWTGGPPGAMRSRKKRGIGTLRPLLWNNKRESVDTSQVFFSFLPLAALLLLFASSAEKCRPGIHPSFLMDHHQITMLAASCINIIPLYIYLKASIMLLYIAHWRIQSPARSDISAARGELPKRGRGGSSRRE